MKTVVKGKQVCHLWAHAAQDHARNSGNNLYFNYGVLYSYGAHFPIGLRLKRKGRDTAQRGFFYLLTEDTYSATTSKQQHWARWAVPGECHYVPRLSNGSSSETIDLASVAAIVKTRARESLAEGLRMHKSYKRYSKAQDARRWYTSVQMAATATGQKKKIARILGSIQKDYYKVMQGYAEYEEKMKAARARKEENEKKRHAARAARMDAEAQALGFKDYEDWYNQDLHTKQAAALAAWRNHGRAMDYHLSLYSLPNPAMRISSNKTEIETTKGASFPKEHAIKLYPLWVSLVSHKRGYKRNGHTIHLGAFAVDEITPEGDIKAGCHHIKADEVRLLAQALGLMPVLQGIGNNDGTVVTGEAMPRTVHDLLPGDSFKQ